MERDSGFIRRTSNMVKLQDIGGTVLSGRSMVLMKDLLKRLLVIQSLHRIKNKRSLWKLKPQGSFSFVLPFGLIPVQLELFLKSFIMLILLFFLFEK